VAESLAQEAVGEYAIVTRHDLPGPRLVPEHASLVIANADEPATATSNAPEALPPEFVNTNASDAVPPTPRLPKSLDAGANASAG
jgi:hypothetical protein